MNPVNLYVRVIPRVNPSELPSELDRSLLVTDVAVSNRDVTVELWWGPGAGSVFFALSNGLPKHKKGKYRLSIEGARAIRDFVISSGQVPPKNCGGLGWWAK